MTRILRSSECSKNSVWHFLDHLESLYPIVSVQQYKLVLQSIKKDGLKFPIVVWDTVGKYWKKQVRFTDPSEINCPPEDFPDDQPVLLVMCGNNRLHAAYELGYEAIDCIVTKSREDINKLCGGQREHWREVQKSLTSME